MIDTKNVLIEYKRNSRGFPIGVIVAVGPNSLGWSLCNKRDLFVKSKGLEIAINRAYKAVGLNRIEKEVYYTKCPNSIEDLFAKMQSRSYAYFKIPDPIDDNDDLPF